VVNNIKNEFLRTLTDLIRQIDSNITDVIYDFDECEIRVYYKTSVIEDDLDFSELEYRNEVEYNNNCLHCPMSVDLCADEYSAFDLACDVLVGLFM
jgi:hypothetical protein